MTGDRLYLEPLSGTQIHQVQDAALRLLEDVGIQLHHDRATEMLCGLGCQVVAGRVRIPPEVIEWTKRNISPHTVFRSPDGRMGFTLGDGAVRFHNSGSIPFIFDRRSGERRPARLDDVAEASRLLDALPGVDTVLPLYVPQDVSTGLISLAATHATLCNTRKPVTPAPAETPEEVQYIVEMAAACCGGRDVYRQNPTMPIMVSPVTPLTFPEPIAGAIIAVAEAGAPFHPLPAPSLGATGPISMAGALALQHAEALASFTLAAASRPGVPVLYCSRISPIDVRTAISSWGGPEVGMSGAYAASLAHAFGLRCDSYGLATSASRLDPQFAYEKFANAIMPALAGVDLLSGFGSSESNLVSSPEVAVIDNEMSLLVRHMVKGYPINPDTLALEVMKEVIPRDGVFLGELHTVQQMRQGALWMPEVSERAVASESDSGAGVISRARAKAAHLLREHTVTPWPDDVRRDLDEVLVQARKDLARH